MKKYYSTVKLLKHAGRLRMKGNNKQKGRMIFDGYK